MKMIQLSLMLILYKIRYIVVVVVLLLYQQSLVGLSGRSTTWGLKQPHHRQQCGILVNELTLEPAFSWGWWR